MSARLVASGIGVVVSAAGLAVLGRSRPDRDPEAKARLIEAVAGDFFFRAPDSIAAGRVRIRLVNQGAEFHHMQMLRFENGHSIQEVTHAMAKPDVGLPWITFVGGPSTAPPNGVTEVETVLRPGHYAILCFVTTKDGVRHLMKGMIRELTVTEPDPGQLDLPAGDVAITLSDYDFAISRPLTAGRQRIRVTNRGPQSHEVGIAVLAPGVTEEMARAWLLHPKGSPPAIPVGGVMDLSPGEVNLADVDLPVGTMVLLCFAPDRSDGRSHIAHGMVRFVGVRK